jgi:DNA replication and repair protein RecF
VVPAVTRLGLNSFRSYGALSLEIDPRPVVLTGPNGAGKTNLLEALSLLAPGRGLRRARLADLDRRLGGEAGQPWTVAAGLRLPAGDVEIGTGREPGPESAGQETGRDRRVVKIDGRFVRGASALAKVFSVAWLTPAQDRLFLDRAGERRRFLDRLVYGLDSDHAERVSAYDRAMSGRGHLLRQPGSPDGAWLAALEAQMAEHGVAVAVARRDLVARLNTVAAERASGPFPRPALAMTGGLESWLDQAPALAVEERLMAALADARPRDREAGGAAVGPHRGDLSVVLVAKNRPAAECSTGEQKALLIATLLAHARLVAAARGLPPLLLLDEIIAHLDAARRAALFAELLALGGQCWLTGQDESLFAEMGDAAQFLRLAEGMPVRRRDNDGARS